MNQKEIDKLIRSGDLIITTKEILTEAVVQAVEYLYQDNGEFSKNRYMSAREYEQLNKKDCTDVADDVIDYLID